MSFNQRTTVFSFINKYDENTEYTFTQPTVIKSSFLSTQGTCVLDGSYAGTELFHGEMGSRNAFEVSNDSNCGKALRDGEILRTHVMRPTWHLVAAEDIRWMLKLSAGRIISANESYAKGHDLEISEELYTKSHNLLEKILCGKKSLTRQEIAEHFNRLGVVADNHRMTRFMARAEQVGIVCSGEDKGSKCTYALLEERVPPVPELTKDESLARLARSYFRSHAPAVLQDFVWWSGLPITDARQAIYLIDSELTAEEWNGQTWYIHEDCRTRGKVTGSLHLLPSYDEYLLGYKDRTDVLPKEHYSKAFTNNGLFYPIVLHEGQVIGNWDKSVKREAH